MNTTYSYLALGDSYTIGEAVPLFENYPYQCVQLLRKEGKTCFAPEIVAKTGWTTTELRGQIEQTILCSKYDMVSLLIGVNNQYRGLPVQEYSAEFEELLQRAISLAGNNPHRVFVLSIPDWGVTPFAKGRDRTSISAEIVSFNAINHSLSKAYQTHYINITEGSPETENNPDYLSNDGLHPSGKAYTRWAKLLSNTILSTLR